MANRRFRTSFSAGLRDKALSIVASLLEGFLCPGAGRCVTVISSVTVPYGAIRVFGQLQDALNAIWEVESKVRPTIFRRLRRRFRAFVTTLMAGTLILLVIHADLSVHPG